MFKTSGRSRQEHIEQCCKSHLCKWNDIDCPVYNGEVEPTGECEECKVEAYLRKMEAQEKGQKDESD